MGTFDLYILADANTEDEVLRVHCRVTAASVESAWRAVDDAFGPDAYEVAEFDADGPQDIALTLNLKGA